MAAFAAHQLRCEFSSVLGSDLHLRGLRDDAVCRENVTLLGIHDHAGARRVDLLLELLRNVEEFAEEGTMIEWVGR